MTRLVGKSVLVTGGTGSFGRTYVQRLLRETEARRIIVFSRDEHKQFDMQRGYKGERRLRFFIGDVRDPVRLHRAFHDVDIVVHAAAMKQIQTAEYNPIEAVRTNIGGAENIINAAIDCGVERVIALSTDKASSPINLYGATKLVSDKLFVTGNAYSGDSATRMAVVRYGNVMGSRGSVIPHFRELAPTNRIPITDLRMTRFWITLPQAAQFVHRCLERMEGGEIFVPKLPSARVADLARAIAPRAELEVVGMRAGEKLHEEMISVSAARHACDMGDHYVIEPDMEWWPDHPHRGKPVPEGFSYTSENNAWVLSQPELEKLLHEI